MKKRLFAMLLTVTMVMGMVVVPAAAEDTGSEPTATEVCPHCDVAWDACNWQEWKNEDPSETIPTGHYYLSEDWNIDTRYKIGTTDGQTEEYAVDVCLDLRGYSVTQTTADRRAFYVYNYSTFSVMDTVGGGKIVGTGATGNNGSGGTVYACANATVNLYSGTLSHSGADKEKNGGVLFISADATFNMEGGIIDASKVSFDAAGKATPRGGAVYVGGTAQMSGGMILGGYLYQGGAVATAASGTFRMSDGLIFGGEAKSHGGNIFNYGEVHVSGGEVIGGLSGARGGNIYSSYVDAEKGLYSDLFISGDALIADGQASTNGGNVTVHSGNGTISGGTIKGNVQLTANVTLTGSPVIDNCGYEGVAVSEGKTITVDGLTQDAKVILRGEGTITEAADSPDVAEYLEKGYIVPASRYDLAVTEGALVGSQDDNGYCPHCESEVDWKVYTVDTAASGHYYIPSGGVAPDATCAAINIAEDVDIVVNLAHGSVKATAPYTVAGTLSILSTATSIGRFYNTASATTNGGTAYVTGTVNLYDGILQGTETTGNGGALYLDGGRLNMYGGRIEGGSAANGGNIYMNTASAAMVMNGGVIADGNATGGGGNVYMNRGTVRLYDGLVLNGTAEAAGNIYNYTSAKLYIYGGVIANGAAQKTGGNLRHAATSTETTVYDGVIYGGTAGTDGGNGYINNGRYFMYGGSVLNGEAISEGGNLYMSTGKSHTYSDNYAVIGDNDTADAVAAPLISGGKAPTGGNLYMPGDLSLGKCTITGGKADSGADFWLGNNSYLTVEPGFDQELVMTLQNARITELDTDRALANTVCTTLNAKLYVENYDMARLVKTAEGQLGLAGASLVDVAKGDQTWYLTAQEAADACTAAQYVKLYAPENTLVVTDSEVVDLNGTNLTVTGTGTLYGFDTGNDDYDGWGTATVAGVEVEPVYLAPNGRQYVAITDNSGVSFHRLGITTSGVSLRPSISGIYFRGTWQCDSVLQEKIRSFGVAVSVTNMPKDDFASDTDTLYTVFGADEFANGEAKTSVMIKNILKDGAENADRGDDPIYAAPYAILDDGSENGLTVVGEDLDPTKGGVVYSMYDVLRSVNRIWPRLSDSQQAGVKKLYAVDTAVMEGWDLYNITAAVNGTRVDRPLKILTLGHSLAVDSGHMLNLVADAEGYTDLTVATLYFSGCPLYKHVNFLTNNYAEYSLYLSSTETPDAPPTITKNVTMKYAIEYDDWDIIIMQGGVFEIAEDETYTDGNIQIIQDYVNQYKTNRDAIFAWHMAWAPPTDNTLRDKYPNSPNSYYEKYVAYNDDRTALYNAITSCVGKHIVTDDSFIYLIPSGTAIENALSSYLEEADLHRDYVHVSDLGRVISSYTWYCTLIGIDHLDEIKLDAIPKAFLKSTADKTQDRVLTDAEKAIILEAVNNALANPLQMTQSQYTEAPAE